MLSFIPLWNKLTKYNEFTECFFATSESIWNEYYAASEDGTDENLEGEKFYKIKKKPAQDNRVISNIAAANQVYIDGRALLTTSNTTLSGVSKNSVYPDQISHWAEEVTIELISSNLVSWIMKSMETFSNCTTMVFFFDEISLLPAHQTIGKGLWDLYSDGIDLPFCNIAPDLRSRVNAKQLQYCPSNIIMLICEHAIGILANLKVVREYDKARRNGCNIIFRCGAKLVTSVRLELDEKERYTFQGGLEDASMFWMAEYTSCSDSLQCFTHALIEQRDRFSRIGVTLDTFWYLTSNRHCLSSLIKLSIERPGVDIFVNLFQARSLDGFDYMNSDTPLRPDRFKPKVELSLRNPHNVICDVSKLPILLKNTITSEYDVTLDIRDLLTDLTVIESFGYVASMYQNWSYFDTAENVINFFSSMFDNYYARILELEEDEDDPDYSRAIEVNWYTMEMQADDAELIEIAKMMFKSMGDANVQRAPWEISEDIISITASLRGVLTELCDKIPLIFLDSDIRYLAQLPNAIDPANVGKQFDEMVPVQPFNNESTAIDACNIWMALQDSMQTTWIDGDNSDGLSHIDGALFLADEKTGTEIGPNLPDEQMTLSSAVSYILNQIRLRSQIITSKGDASFTCDQWSTPMFPPSKANEKLSLGKWLDDYLESDILDMDNGAELLRHEFEFDATNFSAITLQERNFNAKKTFPKNTLTPLEYLKSWEATTKKLFVGRLLDSLLEKSLPDVLKWGSKNVGLSHTIDVHALIGECVFRIREYFKSKNYDGYLWGVYNNIYLYKLSGSLHDARVMALENELKKTLSKLIIAGPESCVHVANRALWFFLDSTWSRHISWWTRYRLLDTADGQYQGWSFHKTGGDGTTTGRGLIAELVTGEVRIPGPSTWLEKVYDPFRDAVYKKEGYKKTNSGEYMVENIDPLGEPGVKKIPWLLISDQDFTERLKTRPTLHRMNYCEDVLDEDNPTIRSAFDVVTNIMSITPDNYSNRVIPDIEVESLSKIENKFQGVDEFAPDSKYLYSGSVSKDKYKVRFEFHYLDNLPFRIISAKPEDSIDFTSYLASEIYGLYPHLMAVTDRVKNASLAQMADKYKWHIDYQYIYLLNFVFKKMFTYEGGFSLPLISELVDTLIRYESIKRNDDLNVIFPVLYSAVRSELITLDELDEFIENTKQVFADTLLNLLEGTSLVMKVPPPSPPPSPPPGGDEGAVEIKEEPADVPAPPDVQPPPPAVPAVLQPPGAGVAIPDVKPEIELVPLKKASMILYRNARLKSGEKYSDVSETPLERERIVSLPTAPKLVPEKIDIFKKNPAEAVKPASPIPGGVKYSAKLFKEQEDAYNLYLNECGAKLTLASAFKSARYETSVKYASPRSFVDKMNYFFQFLEVAGYHEKNEPRTGTGGEKVSVDFSFDPIQPLAKGKMFFYRLCYASDIRGSSEDAGPFHSNVPAVHSKLIDLETFYQRIIGTDAFFAGTDSDGFEAQPTGVVLTTDPLTGKHVYSLMWKNEKEFPIHVLEYHAAAWWHYNRYLFNDIGVAKWTRRHWMQWLFNYWNSKYGVMWEDVAVEGGYWDQGLGISLFENSTFTVNWFSNPRKVMTIRSNDVNVLVKSYLRSDLFFSCTGNTIPFEMGIVNIKESLFTQDKAYVFGVKEKADETLPILWKAMLANMSFKYGDDFMVLETLNEKIKRRLDLQKSTEMYIPVIQKNQACKTNSYMTARTDGYRGEDQYSKSIGKYDVMTVEVPIFFKNPNTLAPWIHFLNSEESMRKGYFDMAHLANLLTALPGQRKATILQLNARGYSLTGEPTVYCNVESTEYSAFQWQRERPKLSHLPCFSWCSYTLTEFYKVAVKSELVAAALTGVHLKNWYCTSPQHILNARKMLYHANSSLRNPVGGHYSPKMPPFGVNYILKMALESSMTMVNYLGSKLTKTVNTANYLGRRTVIDVPSNIENAFRKNLPTRPPGPVSPNVYLASKKRCEEESTLRNLLCMKRVNTTFPEFDWSYNYDEDDFSIVETPVASMLMNYIKSLYDNDGVSGNIDHLEVINYEVFRSALIVKHDLINLWGLDNRDPTRKLEPILHGGVIPILYNDAMMKIYNKFTGICVAKSTPIYADFLKQETNGQAPYEKVWKELLEICQANDRFKVLLTGVEVYNEFSFLPQIDYQDFLGSEYATFADQIGNAMMATFSPELVDGQEVVKKLKLRGYSKETAERAVLIVRSEGWLAPSDQDDTFDSLPEHVKSKFDPPDGWKDDYKNLKESLEQAVGTIRHNKLLTMLQEYDVNIAVGEMIFWWFEGQTDKEPADDFSVYSGVCQILEDSYRTKKNVQSTRVKARTITKNYEVEKNVRKKIDNLLEAKKKGLRLVFNGDYDPKMKRAKINYFYSNGYVFLKAVPKAPGVGEETHWYISFVQALLYSIHYAIRRNLKKEVKSVRGYMPVKSPNGVANDFKKSPAVSKNGVEKAVIDLIKYTDYEAMGNQYGLNMIDKLANMRKYTLEKLKMGITFFKTIGRTRVAKDMLFSVAGLEVPNEGEKPILELYLLLVSRVKGKKRETYAPASSFYFEPLYLDPKHTEVEVNEKT